MTIGSLSDELAAVIRPGRPLSRIAASLRTLRHRGISREEVQQALEVMRQSAPNEDAEDRILEVMDLVNGFCTPELTVWDDSTTR